MRANLDLNNRSNTSFGMALLKPNDAKAFGKYFAMDKLRFRRGVQQIEREQRGFNHTNLRFNETDNSVSVLVNGGGEARNFKATNNSMTGMALEEIKMGWAGIDTFAKAIFDLVFRPKRLVKANLYEAAEFAKQIEKEHTAEIATQAKQVARAAAQEKAVNEMFKGQ